MTPHDHCMPKNGVCGCTMNWEAGSDERSSEICESERQPRRKLRTPHGVITIENRSISRENYSGLGIQCAPLKPKNTRHTSNWYLIFFFFFLLFSSRLPLPQTCSWYCATLYGIGYSLKVLLCEFKLKHINLVDLFVCVLCFLHALHFLVLFNFFLIYVYFTLFLCNV